MFLCYFLDKGNNETNTFLFREIGYSCFSSLSDIVAAAVVLTAQCTIFLLADFYVSFGFCLGSLSREIHFCTHYILLSLVCCFGFTSIDDSISSFFIVYFDISLKITDKKSITFVKCCQKKKKKKTSQTHANRIQCLRISPDVAQRVYEIVEKARKKNQQTK